MVSRRQLLHAGMAGAMVLATPMATARSAVPLDADIERIYAELFGERRPEIGGVILEVSPLVENGNSVPVRVSVTPELPPPSMLHLIMPRNPETWGGTFRFAPPALAQIDTRVRLSSTQNLTAVAEWPDGMLRAASASVMVTLGACIDENYSDYLRRDRQPR